MRLLSLALVAVASPAFAFTDPAQIDMGVAAFAGATPGHDGGARAPVDRRLRLADCAGDPKFSWRTDRHDTVVVDCAGPQAWRIFVAITRSQPIAATPDVRLASSQPVASLKKADPVIRRGDPVTLGIDQGAFTVTQEGTAISDAAPGERVRIKVDGTRDPVQAVAIAAGQASVPAG